MATRAMEQGKGEPSGGEASAAEAPPLRMICPACNRMFDAGIFVCRGCGSGLLEIPDAPILSGAVIDERYDVEGVIGTGGMGTVYRARQRGMEREVAIKVLHAHYAHQPRAVKRFFREAQAASRLVHPHVVTVYDFGRSSDGDLYMVMELLDGWTLGDFVHYRAPLKPALAISIAVQICDALAGAHARRLVHRDLKPDNVLLTTTEDGLWAKVLDFGIARVMRDPESSLNAQHSTVEIAGTPSYMSPEQILGKEPDPRSDLYSLGIILYEMLTRQRPFEDESSVALCMKQLNEPAPGLGVHAAGSEELERVIQRLLAKQAEDRPHSAEEVKALLLACPEARGPIDVEPLEPGAPRALSQRTTRGDAAILMAQPTLDSSSESRSLSAPLGAVIARAREGSAGRPSARADGPRLVRPGPAPEDVVPQQPAPLDGGVAAVAHLIAEHASVLKSGLVASWLKRRARRDGWSLTFELQKVVVRVGGGGRSPADATRGLVRALAELQSQALRDNVALRVGVAQVDHASALAEALDLSRRVAAASAHGLVSLPRAIASGLELQLRPQTAVFMPNGLQVDTVAASLGEAGDSHELLWGRSLALRRLGQLADEANRQGPLCVAVTGGRGLGRTALARAFAKGRRHLTVRVSPGAGMWPGHTAARLLAAAHGLSRLTGRPEDLAELRLVGVARELTELLLLDRPMEEPPAARALSRLLADALVAYADDGPLAIVLDDAHLMDRASQQIIEAAIDLVEDRPWLILATSRWLKSGMFLADAHRVDLRPLSLRASNAMLESLGVGPRQRHAVMAAAQGNPLALELLASAVGAGARTPTTDVVATLLPGHLRGLEPAEADRAWVAAALGEGPEDLAAQAARLYLDAGLTQALVSWLHDRLRGIGPIPHALARRWCAPEASDHLRRAERCERLGLWRLAAVEHEAGLALVAPEERAGLQLRAAHMRARAGDIRGAVAAWDHSVRAGAGRGRPTELLKFAAVLLEIGEKERAAQVLEHVGTLLDPGAQPRAFAEGLALTSRACAQRGDLARAMSVLAEARVAIERLKRGDARAARGLEALAQEIRAEIAVSQRDRETARTNLRQARDAFRDLGRHADALRCLVDLGRLELEGEDAARAVDTFRAAGRLASAAGLGREILRAEVGLGEALVAIGEVDDGTHLLRRCLRQATDADDASSGFALAATGMARAMLRRCLWADAARYAERALMATRMGRVASRALLAEAEAHIGQDQPRRAARALEEGRRVALALGDGLTAERIEALMSLIPGGSRDLFEGALSAAG